MEEALKVTDNGAAVKNIYIPCKPSLLIKMHHCIFFGLNCNIKFIFLFQTVQRNKSVVPSNEALIISGNKPSFVVPFRIITHLFLKKNKLSVNLNAISMSLVTLPENRFEP